MITSSFKIQEPSDIDKLPDSFESKVASGLIDYQSSLYQSIRIGNTVFHVKSGPILEKFLKAIEAKGISTKKIKMLSLRLNQKIECLSNELWKIFEDDYSISSLGRVKSLKRGHESLLKGGLSSGYKTVLINSKLYYVHRLVAMSFIDNPENCPEVNHKDGDKLNNHVENLEWVSHADNQYHARVNGLYRKGRCSQHAKEVELIKNKKIVKTFRSGQEAADFLGISRHNLYISIKRETEQKGFVIKYKKPYD